MQVKNQEFYNTKDNFLLHPTVRTIEMFVAKIARKLK